MSLDRDRAALELFEAALAVSPADRDAWVEKTSGNDLELANHVRSLLEAYFQKSDFLQVSPVSSTVLGQAAGATGVSVGPGQRIGDFFVEHQIGAGGMGLVYKARQVSLNRSVALKVLPPALSISSNARQRFQREVEAAARLIHPNVVSVYTTGETENIVYYAMELVDGPSLNELIQQFRIQPPTELKSCKFPRDLSHQVTASTDSGGGDLTPFPDGIKPPINSSTLGGARGYFRRLAELMSDVADGLDYAHQMNVIHRDIKPSNLFVSKDGRILIGDFGLARISEHPELTHTGEILGTPFYMAPEQISNAIGEIGPPTDVYSLGATLYELLTLQPAYHGRNREQVAYRILNGSYEQPNRLNKAVPRDLNTICVKALERTPNKRYNSARAMADDLRNFIAERPISARPIGTIGRSLKWMQRHRNWAASIALVLCMATVTAYAAYRMHLTETRWSETKSAELFEAAQLAALKGDLESATRSINDAVSLGAPQEQINLLRGQVALEAGQFQKACDTLEKAVIDMPESLAAYALLANAYDANELHKKRAEITAQLANLKPNTLQDYLLLGQALVHDDRDTAISTLNDAVQRFKSSVAARLIRGRVLINRAVDTASSDDAELALADLNLASQLLEPNVFLLSEQLEAHLAAATAHAVSGNTNRQKELLQQAQLISEQLTKFDQQHQSHRWRAFYFDYVGQDELAIREWFKMKELRIAYLLLALYRAERFDEALALCDERLARYPGARFTEFFKGFILSAVAESPDPMIETYEPSDEETLDPLNAHRFTYTICCLAGLLDEARERSRRYREKNFMQDNWSASWRQAVDFACGDLAADIYVKNVSDSRQDLCIAYYYVGLKHLADGDRVNAKLAFEASKDLRIVGYLEDHMSRALLAQLERDSNWPKWIPKR